MKLTMANFKPAPMARHKAEPVSGFIKAIVQNSALAPGLYSNAIYEAWDKFSGAASYSSNKYFKNNILHVTISSSVLRSSLAVQLDFIKDSINQELEGSFASQISGLTDKVKQIKLH